MGYDRHFPRDIAFGHQDFGGLNLKHLYSVMLGSKLESVIANCRNQTALGRAFIININQLQLLSGLQTPILESTQHISYIDNNWLLHLRDFIIEIGGRLELPNLWQPELQRENDVFLMEKFIKLNLTPNELRLVNNWRLYFKVNCLSDICDASENRIQAAYLTQKRDNATLANNNTTLNWPNQEIPGDKGFKLWIRCLKQCFGLDTRNRLITHKIGYWLPNIHNKYNKWDSYFDLDANETYIHDDSIIYSWKNNTIGRNKATNSNVTERNVEGHIPSKCIPATTRSSKRILITTFCKPKDYRQTPIIASNKELNKTFKEFIASLPSWKQDMMSNVTILNPS
jgi:hypothetical protein